MKNYGGANAGNPASWKQREQYSFYILTFACVIFNDNKDIKPQKSDKVIAN